MYYTVTAANFFEVLPIFEEATSKADFLAFDCELTGLSDERLEGDASPERIFESIKSASLRFLPLQLGVCTFRYDDKASHQGEGDVGEQFRVSIFEFYLRPAAASRTYDSFLCQAGSVAMLTSTGFSFQRAFADGVPFLSLSDERELHVRLESLAQLVGARRTYDAEAIRADLHCRHSAWFTPPGNCDCVGEFERRLSALLRGEACQGSADTVQFTRFEHLSAFERKVLDSVLHSLNACDSLYIVEAPRLEHLWNFTQPEQPDAKSGAKGRSAAPETQNTNSSHSRTGLSSLRSMTDCCDVLVYRISSPAHYKAAQEERVREYRAQLEQASAFRTFVASRLAHARCVVAHNALLDCAHMLHAFFAPRSLLNATLPQFRALLRETFNAPLSAVDSAVFFDTKFLACNLPLPVDVRRPFCSSLRGLFQFVSQPPFHNAAFFADLPAHATSEPLPNSLLASDNRLLVDRVVAERMHSAGFDAFVTGVCFAKLARLAFTQAPQFAHALRRCDEPLRAVRNRIFCARMLNRRCLVFEQGGKSREDKSESTPTHTSAPDTASKQSLLQDDVVADVELDADKVQKRGRAQSSDLLGSVDMDTEVASNSQPSEEAFTTVNSHKRKKKHKELLFAAADEWN